MPKTITMFQHIYTLFIAPHKTDPDQRNRELVLNWLLTGIVFLLSIFFVNAVIQQILSDKNLIGSLVSIGLILAVILTYLLLLRTKRHAQTIASYLLLALFFYAGYSVVLAWGIVNPYGALMFSLVIVASGILLSARHALYAVIVVSLSLTLFEYLKSRGVTTPDTSWIASPSSMADVINFTTLFLVMGLVSWLFNRQMEESLHRAQRSEKELKHERDMLEVKVEERTRALQEAQLEKVQQVYKFAELGHLSTALFHDLAGSLSSLTLDIESMRKKGKTDFTKRIDNNIHYIDSVVQRVKSQIHGNNDVETFDALAVTKELVGILSYNARKARTHIGLHADKNKPIIFTGNLTRFRQLIINLLSNAIEAYPLPTADTMAKDRPVLIKMSQEEGQIIIEVTDFGKGIQKATQPKVFDPFFTTKSTGSGIGLFIVRQVAENDFSGKIKLTSNKKTGTTFTVTIPK